MRLRDVQRGQQPEYVLIARRTDKNMLVVDQFLAQRSRILEQLDADHQPSATYFLDTRQLFQLSDQVVSQLAGMIDQPVGSHHVGHGDRGRAGQMIAAERRAEHAELRSDVRRDRYGADRETVAEAFGHRIDIGVHAGPVGGVVLAATSATAP